MRQGPGVDVDLGELDQHTGEVKLVGNDVRSCAQRADGLGTIGNEAFGIVGQTFAGTVQGWIGNATKLLHTCADGADDIAGRLGDSHEDYSANEKAGVQTFDAIRPRGGAG
jgi:hypothetical protein